MRAFDGVKSYLFGRKNVMNKTSWRFEVGCNDVNAIYIHMKAFMILGVESSLQQTELGENSK